MQNKNKGIPRRQFLATAAGVSVAGFVGGLHALPTQIARPREIAPGQKLNIAIVGLSGRAVAHLNAPPVKAENVVALCDVDTDLGAKAFSQYPEAKQYQDYRKMLGEMHEEIDAVIVCTPDHVHAPIAMEAMRRGKHVYCEKPLAHSLHEARALTLAARKYGVATQLGNQGHSSEHIRLFCEWIQDGAIGAVREVHLLCNSSYSRIKDLEDLKERPPVPASLDWDLWLGPARERPYHPYYHPRKWRNWTPFGTGVPGDWTCHILDPVFWAFDLEAPSSVLATAENYDPVKHADTFPAATKIVYEFPAKGGCPALTVTWYDGDSKPPLPKKFWAPSRRMPEKGGVVYGETGLITYGSHGANGCRILPESKMKSYKKPEKTIPRSQGHHKDWILACKGGAPASSNFDYGGPLSEVPLLGNIAIRHLGQKLEWDSKKMKITNNSEANRLVNPAYREGWSL